MFDFLRVVKEWDGKKQRYVYSPSFFVHPNIKDLMVRSKGLYGIYDESTGLWETDDAKAISMIDQQVRDYAFKDAGEDAMADESHGPLVKQIADTSNRLIERWHTFCEKDLKDHWVQLNQKVIFSNTEIKRTDYATFKLNYPLVEGPTPYYDKLCSVLYSPEEQEKWEWAVGCIIAGDQKKIQKMLVFYGEPGSGKSTIIGKIIADGIFGGYETGYAVKFEANNLASRDSFATDFLEHDSVLAYDDDAELGVITTKTTLNKIISHEPVRVNCKFKPPFVAKPNCLLIVGSNEPVQMSPNSGMNRRLIDIRPTGNKLPSSVYDECIEHIPFEKGGIAWKCLQTYKHLGRHYYDGYVAEDMLLRTSPFHNFVTENYFQLKDGTSLANAYQMYKDYAEACNFKNVLTRYKFRDTLKLYFEKYEDMKFSGFKSERIGIKEEAPKEAEESRTGWLEFTSETSLFDIQFKDEPAQYANEEGNPSYKWAKVKTTLKQLDTHKLHYVKVPVEHIVIDFDIKGEDGSKDFQKNLAAANAFPPTYAELSKSGSGIHLHYIYTGEDPEKLSRIFGDNVEIKVFTGNASLRRKLTKCNNLPVAELNSGLPLKEGGKEKVVDWDGYNNEKIIRAMIIRNLNKEYHAYTKPSIDYIEEILSQAYTSGVHYDFRGDGDLQGKVYTFAQSSTNHADYCLEAFYRMHFCSKDVEDAEKNVKVEDLKSERSSMPIIFLDCEIKPSYKQAQEEGVQIPEYIPKDTPALFLVNWKFKDDEPWQFDEKGKVIVEGHKTKNVVRMINPAPQEIESLFKYRIIGFNNRNYDNHMLFARAQGYSSEELYKLSQRLISGDRTAKFGQAYNISETDIYDFSSVKQGLKKWEIQFGWKHMEMSRPWNEPIPVSEWETIAAYCDNDVISTEMVYDFCHPDLIAREILTDLTDGITLNDTTNQLTTKLIANGEPVVGLRYTDFMTGKSYGPGEKFNLPIISSAEYEQHLATKDWEGIKPVNSNHFPGYYLVKGEDGKVRNMYRGIDVGFGGYVYANPGMYANAITFDVASMHPHSIKELYLFDKQTQNYVDLMNARIFIKHKDYESAKKLFGGKLAPYLTNDKDAKTLSKALKLALNSTYGLTSATFPNKLRDDRNVNNIVALRGALFMKTLQDNVESMGYKVIHIKTDSIKIANPDERITNYILNFGKDYGYDFEVEHTWKKICLVNDAVFIGMHGDDDPESPGEWEATGTQFQIPYVFKSLFSHEEIIFDDLCKTLSVQKGSLHLVFDDGDDRFIGRVGRFTPMQKYGASLYRVNEGKQSAATGTKGYKWLDTETVEDKHLENYIDRSYFTALCDDAIATINKFGDFDEFVSDSYGVFTFDAMNPPIPSTDKEELPWDEYVEKIN